MLRLMIIAFSIGFITTACQDSYNFVPKEVVPAEISPVVFECEMLRWRKHGRLKLRCLELEDDE